MNIGKSLVFRGDLGGSEDLTIEGDFEGTIQLDGHILTIGTNGSVRAAVFAKSVVVLGNMTGTVTAGDMVEIRDGASVEGDIVAPRVAVAEGAYFRGSVDMRRQTSAMRFLAEVSVPDSDRDAAKNTDALKHAVIGLLAAFDYSRALQRSESVDLRQYEKSATVSSETRPRPGR